MFNHLQCPLCAEARIFCNSTYCISVIASFFLFLFFCFFLLYGLYFFSVLECVLFRCVCQCAVTPSLRAVVFAVSQMDMCGVGCLSALPTHFYDQSNPHTCRLSFSFSPPRHHTLFPLPSSLSCPALVVYLSLHLCLISSPDGPCPSFDKSQLLSFHNVNHSLVSFSLSTFNIQ